LDYPLFLPSQAVTRLLTPAAVVVDAAAAADFEEAAVDSEEVVDSADLRWVASVVARPWVVFAERPASVRGPVWEWPAALEWECARP
jgi:hypothetical protein